MDMYIFLGYYLGMKKKIVYVLCWFIPSRRLRHRLHAWAKRKKPCNNIIEIVKQDGRRIRVKRVRGCRFVFSGDNNHVVLHEPLGKLDLHVRVSSGVYIELQSSIVYQRKIKIIKYAGEQYQNSLFIGKNFSTTNYCVCDFCTGPGNITIGCGCLFADGVLWTGDWHTLYDCNDGKVLNANSDICIGNHVWLATGCMLLKGANIADNSVVGARSIVNKKFDKPNVVIAGVPAKIVKENVNWDVRAPHQYAMENNLK